MTEAQKIQCILDRERLTLKEAQKSIEFKSLELYESNQKLLELNAFLEKQIERITRDILVIRKS